MPRKPTCGCKRMRIRCYRVEGARRRVPSSSLLQRPGHRKVPGLFVFQPSGMPLTTRSAMHRHRLPHAVIALHDTVVSTRWTFIQNLLRGATEHWIGSPLRMMRTPGLAPGVRSISGVSSPHRQRSAAWTAWRDVQGRGPSLCSDVDGAARSPRCSSREATTEMDHSSPGDGTGIRVRFRSGILGVRLSPGAPAFYFSVSFV